ncbi:hypothetical protein [Algoriphagus aquimarinus]
MRQVVKTVHLQKENGNDKHQTWEICSIANSILNLMAKEGLKKSHIQ